MLVPVNWLKEYVDFDLGTSELADKLTMVGLEVEEVKDVAGEAVLLLKVTSNRGDCLSMIGVAREVAAILGSKLKIEDLKVKESKEETSSLAEVEIASPHLCPRYSARIIKGVKVAPSPLWLQKRLKAAGVRPINNLVDATNYVMWEQGQPLHAFDYELLGMKKIIVRKAKEGERMVTLDGEARELSEDVLVIAEPLRAVAIAGVMGGLNTEVSEKTKVVLLESAHFNPVSVRMSARKLSLSTEASFRFERGVDPQGTVLALNRVAKIIKEIAGGEITKGVIDCYPKTILPKVISFRPQRANKILGTNLSSLEMEEILSRLELKVDKEEKSLKVTVPTFRPDLTEEIDLVEEIARIYGYDQIKTTLPRTEVTPGRQSSLLSLEDKAREVLSSAGLRETITFSLTNPSVFDKILFSEDDPRRQAISLKNPLTKDYTILRTTLLPSLLGVVKMNASHKVGQVFIYELGRVYLNYQKDSLPQEVRVLAGAISAEVSPRSTVPIPQPTVLAGTISAETSEGNSGGDLDSFLCLKGIVGLLFKEMGILNYEMDKTSHPTFSSKRVAKIKINGEEVGILGEVSPQVRENFGIDGSVFIFEVNFDKLSTYANLERHYISLPKYPAVRRDIAILVKEEVSSEQIVNIIKKAGGNLLERVDFFDLYRGEQIPEGFKSLAYTLTYRDKEKTLTDEEVKKCQDKVIEELKVKLSARIREKESRVKML